MNCTQSFTEDFDLLTSVLHPDYSGPPISCSRFGDGEYAILRGMAYKAKSDGWQWGGQRHSLQNDLLRSLVAGAELPGYYVGISSENHHPRAYRWYAKQIDNHGVPVTRITFASLFIFANYERFRRLDLSHCVTVGRGSADLIVPSSPAAESWPEQIETLVDILCGVECPILISAGPWASIIVHRYWKLMKDNPDRQTIIDVGSAMDERLHGRRTRRYHLPDNPQRNWIPRMENEQKPVVVIRHEGRKFRIAGISDDDLLFRRWRRSQKFYELELLEGIRRITTRGIFIDAGAHFGNHSLFFMAFCQCTTLIAVEPGLASHSRLRENLAANFPHHVDQIKAVRFILGDAGDDCRSLSSVDRTNTASRSVVPHGSEQCECTTIDKLIESLQLENEPVSCIKVDTEGMELQVIRGAAKAIERWGPVIAAEAATDVDRVSIGQILEPFGYMQTDIRKIRGVPSYVWAVDRSAMSAGTELASNAESPA